MFKKRKLVFTKKLICNYCKYAPKAADLGQPCPQCGAAAYVLVDIAPIIQDDRQTHAVDNRQHGPI